ncbi:hypothetical protein [Escherichia phage Greed]|nr:hypothetical protein [Escherichia phage Greed]
MVRILERYKNEATGAIAFKRMLVKQIDGLFRVVKEVDYGNGAGVSTTIVPGIKAYKTLKGAEKALAAWKPARYQMSRVEGLMQEGKI